MKEASNEFFPKKCITTSLTIDSQSIRGDGLLKKSVT